MTGTSKPVVAITAGDPSGIGPEIARAAASAPAVRAVCEPVIYGPVSDADIAAFPAGEISAQSGQASYDAVCRAVADALAGRVDAVATAPIHKAAWDAAGYRWRGHTDLLAHLCSVEDVAMLFWSPTLKVVLATVHVPLREVAVALTADRLAAVIRLTAEAMPRFGIVSARLALAGLNPHAGEHGLIGHEEDTVMAPVVAEARARGVDIAGPLPGDTVFTRAARGDFDVVIAAYHDQGLIPVKLLAFGRAVNVTIGLPIVRTSVDHGTAFDIARRGTADPSSLIEAVILAARLARGQVRAGA